ncbi:multi antimicrobial extrusion protein MatE [Methylosinus sp. RM1]|uniref:multi antimicrobial extrusion protein MatE n=1 Tax=Methylosinus sp. RM1 TaxID=2583817 RepID=UPI00140C13F5|nr:multi antimicrobial extrusion protein MatE [Methylosinus sp. RM1]
MIEKGFWRGYWPLLITLGAVQISQQLDIVMLRPAGSEAQNAYALLARLAMIDTALMTAVGAVASTTVAQKRRTTDASALDGALLLSLLSGIACAAGAFVLYPGVATLAAGDGPVSTLIAAGIGLYAVTTPLRFLVNSSVLMLHALNDGAAVVRWKVIELALKFVGNLLFIDYLGGGFSGCFASGLLVAAISAAWCWRALAAHRETPLRLPTLSFAAGFFRSAAWEAQRTLAIHLAIFAGVALFATPSLGHYELARLSAYATGQTLMLAIIAPLLALTRFLSFRLARLDAADVAPFARDLWLRGAPIACLAALALLASRDPLGNLYGQAGPWWSSMIAAIAVSLPIRHSANVARAGLFARGAFAVVAITDSIALWSCGVPLLALGLLVDAPEVAYLSLIVPEAACAHRFWRSLPLAPPHRASGSLAH